MKKNFHLGAAFPPGMEWQIGKTAASISFVKDCEIYLQTHPEAEEKLRPKIDAVKDGKITLTSWKTPEEALKE